MLDPPLYSLSGQQQARLIQELADELSRQPAVIFAYLHGSALDGEAVHDVDIGVYLGESESGQAAAIVDMLAGRLNRVLGLPIDLSVLNRAPLTFLYHVLRGRLLCSRNDDLLASMLEDVARRYLDLAPLLRQATKEAFAA
jgi:predicted nucleotidyltransferase